MNSTRTLLVLLVVSAAGVLAALLTVSERRSTPAAPPAPGVERRTDEADTELDRTLAAETSSPDETRTRESAGAPSLVSETGAAAALGGSPEAPPIQSRVHVTVVDWKDRQRALPGFRFDVVLSHNVGMNLWRDRSTLAELESGATGVWDGEIERPAELEDRHYWILRAREPGYQERVAVLYHEVRDDPSTPLVATIAARPGSSAAGRLVDADGSGVAGRIQFTRSAEIAKYPSFTQSYSRTTDPAGDFVLFLEENLKFDRDGMIEGTLTATAETGTALLADQRWSLDEPPQDLVLTLAGEGSLSGVVRDASGAPAPGLPLLVVLDSFAKEGRKLAYVGQRAVDRMNGDGLASVRLITDSGGCFEARGLRVAPYTVRVLAGLRSHMPNAEETLTPEPVLADGRHLELVHSRPTLRLTLLTPTGESWRGDVHFSPIDGSAPWLPSDWPSVPTVLVAATRSVAGKPTFSDDPGRNVVGRRLPDGSLVFEAGGDDEFEVRVVGGSGESGHFDGSPLRMALVPGEYCAERELRAAAKAAPMGTVHISVLTIESPDRGRIVLPWVGGEERPPEPEPKRVPFSADTGYRLIVVDAANGAAIAESRRSESVSPWTLRLPAGRYRLRPWRDPYAASTFVSGDIPIPPVGDDWVFEVRAGDENHYAVESAIGARIELTIEADAAAAQKGYSYPVLVDAIGREIPLSRGEYQRNNSGMSLTPRWPAGATTTSERVAAGRYQLRGTVSPSGRSYDRTVVLEEGKTLRVTL